MRSVHSVKWRPNTHFTRFWSERFYGSHGNNLIVFGNGETMKGSRLIQVRISLFYFWIYNAEQRILTFTTVKTCFRSFQTN